MKEDKSGWLVIHSEEFLNFLVRAACGEEPHLLYIEMYANCEHHTDR